jgi:hypothetical protein
MYSGNVDGGLQQGSIIVYGVIYIMWGPSISIYRVDFIYVKQRALFLC